MTTPEFEEDIVISDEIVDTTAVTEMTDAQLGIMPLLDSGTDEETSIVGGNSSGGSTGGKG